MRKQKYNNKNLVPVEPKYLPVHPVIHHVWLPPPTYLPTNPVIHQITPKGYHVNVLPPSVMADCLPARPPITSTRLLQPLARQSPSTPACPIASAHCPLVRRLLQANSSATCAGFDGIAGKRQRRKKHLCILPFFYRAARKSEK